MNLEQNKDFEARLRSLKPVQAGSELETGIAEALRQSARERRMAKLRSALSWGGMALAASLLMTFGFLLFNGRFALEPKASGPPPSSAVAVEEKSESSLSAPDAFKPVLAENTLQNRVDEGIVFLRNGLTARRYRYEFVDRVVWRNPVDGATVEMKIPRDEVILVPVQTF